MTYHKSTPPWLATVANVATARESNQELYDAMTCILRNPPAELVLTEDNEPVDQETLRTVRQKCSELAGSLSRTNVVRLLDVVPPQLLRGLHRAACRGTIPPQVESYVAERAAAEAKATAARAKMLSDLEEQKRRDLAHFNKYMYGIDPDAKKETLPQKVWRWVGGRTNQYTDGEGNYSATLPAESK